MPKATLTLLSSCLDQIVAKERAALARHWRTREQAELDTRYRTAL
jgi:hypothetical protein